MFAQVCIERCDALGSLVHRQHAKGITVKLSSVDGKPFLVISMQPKQVSATSPLARGFDIHRAQRSHHDVGCDDSKYCTHVYHKLLSSHCPCPISYSTLLRNILCQPLALFLCRPEATLRPSNFWKCVCAAAAAAVRASPSNGGRAGGRGDHDVAFHAGPRAGGRLRAVPGQHHHNPHVKKYKAPHEITKYSSARRKIPVWS